MLDDPYVCGVGMRMGYGTDYTDLILTCVDEVNVHELKKEIQKYDKLQQMERCSVKAPLITEVVKRGGSWPAL